jgi:hypothetical protein
MLIMKDLRLAKKEKFNKTYLYFIIFLIMTAQCVNQSNKLMIETNGDSLIHGTDFKAELFVPYKTGFLPAFKIIRGADTTWLPVDTIKKCAVLIAASNRPGDKVYNGIVDYINNKGNKRSEKFSIKYYVK